MTTVDVCTTDTLCLRFEDYAIVATPEELVNWFSVHRTAKLEPQDVARIKAMREAGYSARDLARRFHVSERTIFRAQQHPSIFPL